MDDLIREYKQQHGGDLPVGSQGDNILLSGSGSGSGNAASSSNNGGGFQGFNFHNSNVGGMQTPENQSTSIVNGQMGETAQQEPQQDIVDDDGFTMVVGKKKGRR